MLKEGASKSENSNIKFLHKIYNPMNNFAEQNVVYEW